MADRERERLPKYVWRHPGRGKPMYYFRIKRNGRTTPFRLPDDPTSAAFHARYAELLAGLEKGGQRQRAAEGTIGALVAAFKVSPEFKRLSAKTIEYHLRHLDALAPLARYPAGQLSRAHVLALRDKLSHTPRSADQRVAVIRRLYAWGVDRMLVKINPAERIAKLDVDPGSYEPWSAEERARFVASRPPQPLLTAFMIASYGSPRRGDILRLTRADYDGDLLRLCPRKTKRRGVSELVIPCHSALRAHLDTLPIEVGLLVPGPGGKAWEPSAFSKAFRAWCDGIGLQGRHLHGLRHTCAVSLVEAGCTEEETQAILGHAAGSPTTKRYTRRARQETLARAAIRKMEGRG